MADVFISFAQHDRRMAWALADYLQSEGLTVWWDRSLDPSVPPGSTIVRQIASAHAVVAIWTETSVNSQRVRAEAAAAESAQKLVTAKAADLPQSAIPPSFRERLAIDAADTRAIKAAIASRLAIRGAPAAEPQRTGEDTRNTVLKWSAIAVGSLTLYSHAGPALGLTYWAHTVVEYWTTVVHAIWAYPLSLLNMRVPLAVSLMCTLVVSLLLIAISERLRSGLAPELELPREKRDELTSRIQRRYLEGNGTKANDLIKATENRLSDKRRELALPLIPPLVIFGAFVLWPLQDAIISIFSSRNYVGKFVLLKYVIFFVPLAMLYIAPLRPMIKRLWFVVIGCLVLAGLNEAWKLTSGEESELLKLLGAAFGSGSSEWPTLEPPK